MTDPESPTAEEAVVIALFVSSAAEPWAPTLVSLHIGCPRLQIVAGASEASVIHELTALGERCGIPLETRVASDAAELMAVAARDLDSHVLLITAPVVVPPQCLERAIELADADLRCASVSFFSNAAGYLSFPTRGVPTTHQIGNLDEVSITRRLRHRSPALAPIPIPYATGSAVLITRQGLSLVWPPPMHGPDQTNTMLYDYSARTRAHGMVDYLDPSTFIMRPRDVLEDFGGGWQLLPKDVEGLPAPTAALALASIEDSEPEAGLSQVFRAARSAVLGLRVIIDGTCLGPTEMGSQVSVVGLIKALADQADIAYVGVAVPGTLPAYAAEELNDSKVDVRLVRDGDFTIFPHADIVHRPFQPGHGMRPETWMQVGCRTVLTILDLIAYQVPGYHDTPQAWFGYRSVVRGACSWADGLIVISDDVRRAVTGERLPIDTERVFVVPVGTSHLRGDEPEVMPGELLYRGFTGDEFLLVLGTNYSHKNRDLAIRTLRELTARGRSLTLVMAGAHVPCGSSRAAEAASWSPGLPVHVIPDVTSAERNWLLRHASIVLYPTSAEGFGLVPEEAAAFGTPALFVPFGPLGERYAGVPVRPMRWSAEAFADAVEALLDDPSRASEQVAAIANGGTDYDWGHAAEATVAAYWAVLGRPARGGTYSGRAT